MREERSEPSVGRRSPKAIEIFIAVSLLSDAISLGRLLQKRLLFDRVRPLGLLNEYAPDWSNYAPQAARFHQPNFFHPPGMIELFTYPAPASIIYFLLHSTHYPIAALKLTVVLTALVIAIVLFRILRQSRMLSSDKVLFLVVAVALSYPFAMEYRQTNIEIFLFLLLAGGVLQFLRRRELSAAALIGIVASIKYYPLALLALFLPRKNWRAIAFGLGTFVITTVVSLWLATGSIANSWAGTNLGIRFFNNYYMSAYRPWETPYDHSLFALLKTALKERLLSGADGHAYLARYMLIVLLLGTILFFARIRKLPVTNQIVCLITAIGLFPPVSYDYTLLHFYVPLCLLLRATLRTKVTSLVHSVTMGLLALIFSWQVPLLEAWNAGGGQLKAIALLVLLVVACVWPLEEESDREMGPGELAVPARKSRPVSQFVEAG